MCLAYWWSLRRKKRYFVSVRELKAVSDWWDCWEEKRFSERKRDFLRRKAHRRCLWGKRSVPWREQSSLEKTLKQSFTTESQANCSKVWKRLAEGFCCSSWESSVDLEQMWPFLSFLWNGVYIVWKKLELVCILLNYYSMDYIQED